MPIGIDFAKIAATFRESIDAQNQPIKDAFESLGKWLSKRMDQTNDLERSSRAFPVIRFYNDAITVWINSTQHGVLGTPEPPRTLGETFSAAGRAFMQGLGRIGQAIKEDLILPQFFGTVAAALDIVLASIEHFAKPSPELFDTGVRRRASDLFGEIGLLISASARSLHQITDLGMNIAIARLVISIAFEPAEKTEEGQSSLPALLDNVTHYLVGAILLLPLLPELWDVIVRSASLSFKISLLTTFEKYEQQIFDFRRDVLDFFFVTLFKDIRNWLGFIIIIQFLTYLYLDFYGSFIRVYTVELLSNIRRVLKDLSDFLAPIIKWAERIRELLDGYLLPILISLLSPALGTLDALLSLAPELPPEARVPRLPPFPNVAETFLGSSETAIRQSFDDLRDEAQWRVRNLFDSGIAAVSDIGQAFEKAAGQAAREEIPTRFQSTMDQSEQLAAAVFGPQRSEAQPEVTTPTAELVAHDFERLLAQGGFYIIGAAIPLYVAEMQRYWQEQKAHANTADEMPTSQHITVRRQRLGLIRVPRVVIRVHERDLDNLQASEIATRFQKAVVGTYQSGLDQLEHARK